MYRNVTGAGAMGSCENQLWMQNQSYLYNLLYAPPRRQFKEQQNENETTTVANGKGSIRFTPPAGACALQDNKMAKKWTKKIENRKLQKEQNISAWEEFEQNLAAAKAKAAEEEDDEYANLPPLIDRHEITITTARAKMKRKRIHSNCLVHHYVEVDFLDATG